MARFQVCAVRDAKVKAFNNPMFFRTNAEAIRSFSDACNDDKNVDFKRHAEDYSIWCVGTWDDDGHLSAMEPECLIQAVDCLS